MATMSGPLAPDVPGAAQPSVLTRAQWEPLAQAHSRAADDLTAGHRSRASRGEKHPIEDFLFDYYGVRPARLRRWYPGPGTVLADAPEQAQWPFYQADARGTSVDMVAFVAARGEAAADVIRLLRATASRPPRLGCFGLHEWAMAYRAEGHLRHPLPLRLGQAGTDEVVESHPIACTHVDAYRFFTPAARPMNTLNPTRDTQVDMEQPGCLHATMDLYKWAAKFSPAVPSDLTLDAFALALEIRKVDMQASPYDVSTFGLDPIAVETAQGKRDYAARQRDFAERGGVLRDRLIAALALVASP